MIRTPKVAAVAAATALIAVMAPSAAEAKTSKELNICWTGQGPTTAFTPRVIIEGQRKTLATTLPSGTCKSFDLRPGEYHFFWDNQDDFFDPTSTEAEREAVCGPLTGGATFWSVGTQSKIRRAGVTYRQESSQGIAYFKKDRRTSISFSVKCRAF